MSVAQKLASFISGALNPALEAVGHDYRVISFAAFLLLAAIKVILGKRGDVDWYAFLHAIVIALGGLICLFMDANASEIDHRGTPEPLRSVRCMGPLTPLHSILPMILLGYSFIDVFDGLVTARMDTTIHGVILGSLMMIACASGTQHIFAYGLIMDLSTVHLNLLKVKWSRPEFGTLNLVSFVVTFFVTRVVAVPFTWAQWLLTYQEEYSAADKTPCHPSYFFWVHFAFGVAFHSLNAYWMYHIAVGAWKRLKGNPSQELENKLDRAAVKGDENINLNHNNPKKKA